LEKFTDDGSSAHSTLISPSPLEQEVANHLAELLQSFVDCNSFSVENDTSLDHVSNIITEDVDDYSKSSDTSGSDPEFIDIDNETEDTFLQKFSLEYMKQLMEYYNEMDSVTGKRRRSFKSVKHRFRRVTDPTYLSCFRSYIEKVGTKIQTLENINNYVYHKFEKTSYKRII
jgi:hypothetical protein